MTTDKRSRISQSDYTVLTFGQLWKTWKSSGLMLFITLDAVNSSVSPEILGNSPTK